MKLLIAGSRKITEYDIGKHIPIETNLIITGGANGVDSLGEAYADAHKISKLILRPDYQRYGRAAPLKRNESMVDLADQVLIIWDGKSKGTPYTLKYAKKLGKPVILVDMSQTPVNQ